MTATFSDDVIQNLSHLQNFARRLARNRSVADDLVQDTVLRALTHADQFQAGTNLRAWLTTILRNTYMNEKRREKRFPSTEIDMEAILPAAHGEQEWHLRMREVEARFATLPLVQREALILVGAQGYSYERAAEIAGCAVGTMKSRASRARRQLEELLDSSEEAWHPGLHAREFAHLAKSA